MAGITYKANSLGAQLHHDKAPFQFLRTCVGAGKTSAAFNHLHLLAQLQEPNSDGVRPTRSLIVRSTNNRLESTAVPTFYNWFGKIATLKLGKVPMKGFVKIPSMFGDGTVVDWEILFMSLEGFDAVDKLKSLEVSNVLFTEAVEIEKVFFDTAKGRIGRYPPKNNITGFECTTPQIICEYNPPHVDHWLAKLEMANPPLHSFHIGPPAVLLQEDGNYVVNPNALNLENLKDNYYANQLDGADESYINVMLMNNFGSLRSDKPVFKNYDDDIHCAKSNLKPLQGVPLVIGMDVGLTPAAAIGQMTPEGQLIVFDEIVEFDMSIDEFIEERLKPKMMTEYYGHSYKVVVDPAAVQRVQTDKSSCLEKIREAGISVTTAKSNNPVDRLGAVDYFLRRNTMGSPGFILSPKANVIRKGLISEYRYEKVKTSTADRYHEKPMKNEYSHVMDALQYLCLEYQAPKQTRVFSRNNNTSYKATSSVAGY